LFRLVSWLAAALFPAAALAASPEDPTPAPAKPAEEAPSPGVAKRLPDRVLRIGLREAVALALKNNLDLRAESLGPGIAAATVRESESLYDHLFTSRLKGSESMAPAASTSFGDGTDIREESLNSGIGVQRLLSTGGTISIGATLDRTLTNSVYYYKGPKGHLQTASTFPDNPYYESGLTLNLSQPLLRRAGREVTESGMRSSRDAKDIADLGLRFRTEDLVQRVETTYWALVGYRIDLEARTNSVSVAEEFLRISEARLLAGAGTKVDVTQAKAGVASRRVDLLKAINGQRSTEEDLLGLLMGRTPGSPSGEPMRVEAADDPNASLPPLPDEDPEAAVARALMDRTDIRIDRAVLDQAQVGVLVAESEAKVQLNLEASIGYSGLSSRAGTAFTRSMATRDWPSWSVGLALEVPIGNRAANARLDRAALTREQAEARLRALESNAAVRVRNARRDIESTREQIDAARTSRLLSEEQLAAEKERLRNDKSTTFEVLRLESDLTEARRTEIGALVGYLDACVRYDYEVGRILESRGLAPPGTNPRDAGGR
jgi:outer membrane protein TolC